MLKHHKLGSNRLFVSLLLLNLFTQYVFLRNETVIIGINACWVRKRSWCAALPGMIRRSIRFDSETIFPNREPDHILSAGVAILVRKMGLTRRHTPSLAAGATRRWLRRAWGTNGECKQKVGLPRLGLRENTMRAERFVPSAQIV